MLSDTSSNNAIMYLQAQSASAQAPVTSALSAGNGVRLKLQGGLGIFSVTLLSFFLYKQVLNWQIFIGLFFAILRIRNNFLSKIAYAYSYIFRGTPLLVQIFIIYYGFAEIDLIRKTFLWEVFKEPYWCAIIAFALNTGAYTSEILRSAFETIKIGYIEAGNSLGISKKLIFYKIQIPIAIKQSLPAYGNEIILMLKGTSLASTVTLMDITCLLYTSPSPRDS